MLLICAILHIVSYLNKAINININLYTSAV